MRAGLALDSFLPSWAQSRVIVGSELSGLKDLDKDYLRENLDELDLPSESLKTLALKKRGFVVVTGVVDANSR